MLNFQTIKQELQSYVELPNNQTRITIKFQVKQSEGRG
jgi:hypothetical protein